MLCAYLIFDVADTIDLEAISKKASVVSERAQIKLRPITAPNYISFPVPPVSIALPDITVFGINARARLKVYDYGVISLRVALPFAGEWNAFVALANRMRSSEELFSRSQEIYAGIQSQIREAFRKPHDNPLFEDYFVFTIRELAQGVTSEQLLDNHAAELAALLRGESKQLSRQEIDETLRLNLSYFHNDLSVVEWDTAFIFDQAEAAETIESILEFANTQLVELRTYDARLNAELDWIYATGPVHARRGPFAHRDANQRAERLRLMLVDIRELVDRTNNALKIIGDAFYARVYRNVRMRLGLADWEKQIDDKLESVSVVYGFLTDQAQHARSDFLELIIIALISFEIVFELIKPH